MNNLRILKIAEITTAVIGLLIIICKYIYVYVNKDKEEKTTYKNTINNFNKVENIFFIILLILLICELSSLREFYNEHK
jgi:ABC-type methionine transport system permease subunit